MESRRKSLERISFDKNVNLDLWFDKFIGNQDDENNSIKEFNSDLFNQKIKIEILDDYRKFFDRRQDCLNEIKPNVCKAIEINSRMIIGLGGESVWESSISIHRTYGVPFIPGSALKGLAARYAHKYLGNEWKKDAFQDLELPNEQKINRHQFIFGSQESAGYITFHDALLIPPKAEEKIIHSDIMTVHHQDYYSEKKDKDGNLFPPADWDSPNPINFVSASGKYQLVLTGIEGCEDWLNIVVKTLEYALRDEGIGAKTSSGYGRADLTDNFHKTKKMEKVEIEQERKESEERLAKIEREKEEVRLAEEKRLEEKRLADEAERKAQAEKEKQNELSRVERIFGQISTIDAKTKKIEKEFEKITETIEKFLDEKTKKKLSRSALEKIEELESQKVKINTSRKWFSSLKKMGGMD